VLPYKWQKTVKGQKGGGEYIGGSKRGGGRQQKEKKNYTMLNLFPPQRLKGFFVWGESAEKASAGVCGGERRCIMFCNQNST